ncbi:MAG: glycosyltransferase family 1 protein, partial [Methylocella sp.]
VLEALVCGLPVAALPVPGPLDAISTSGAGILDADLRAACLAALEIPRDRARAHALNFTWAKSARQFFDNIVVARSSARRLGANSGSPG